MGAELTLKSVVSRVVRRARVPSQHCLRLPRSDRCTRSDWIVWFKSGQSFEFSPNQRGSKQALLVKSHTYLNTNKEQENARI